MEYRQCESFIESYVSLLCATSSENDRLCYIMDIVILPVYYKGNFNMIGM